MYFPFLHFHPFNSVAHISSAASTSTIVIRTLDEGAQFIFRQSIIMKNRDRIRTVQENWKRMQSMIVVMTKNWKHPHTAT